jgi:SWI/SNF-related matrix-associated actin-dependent regulator of chromatin subfamily A3
VKKANWTEQAAGLLRKVVTSICLRRNKSMKTPLGEPIVKLPDVKFYKHTIPLTNADRDYYSKCEAACRDHLSRWADEGNLQGHQSAILTFLLRLRQMSCHRRLIGSKLLEEIQNKDWDSLDKTKTYTKTLTPAAIKELQAKLKVHVEMSDDCPICMEALLSTDKEPVITPCGHPFCKECLSAIVGRGMVNTATCPMDRLPLPPMEQMIELPAQEMSPAVDEVEDVEEEDSEKTSAKVREAMKIIRATMKRDPTEKILVFSNFVQFLNIIQEEMKEAQISHARFNGTLNVVRRDAVLTKFCKPITPRQAEVISRNITRLEQKLQRERAAEKAAEKAAAERAAPSSDGPGPASDASSHKSSSSLLLNSLRTVDEDIKPVKQVPVKAKGRGKQKEEDVFGDNPSVLLISMGCGALGLNLTVASTVLLMDPWWQSSLEQQSIDRTHRIGQKRDVKVFQIIAENTVEARMLEIQATKEGLAETAFSGMRATGSGSDRRTKVETSLKDLVRLFGLSDQETQQLTARSAAVAAGRS